MVVKNTALRVPVAFTIIFLHRTGHIMNVAQIIFLRAIRKVFPDVTLTGYCDLLLDLLLLRIQEQPERCERENLH